METIQSAYTNISFGSSKGGDKYCVMMRNVSFRIKSLDPAIEVIILTTPAVSSIPIGPLFLKL